MIHTPRRTLAPSGLVRLLTALAALIALPAAAQTGAFKLPPGFSGAGGDAEPVTVSVKADSASLAPGAQFVVAVVLDHAPNWHTNLNEPVVPEEMGDFTPIPTTIEISAEGAEVDQGPIQWPEPHGVEVAFTGTPVEYLVYDGRAVVFVPLRLAEDAQPGQTITLSVATTYQACDDVSCLRPETVRSTLTLPVVDPSAAESASDDDFAGFDPAVFAQDWNALASTSTAGQRDDGNNFFGLAIPSWDSPAGFAILAVLSALGGFILNLTPCVLPVIPIKVMTISQHAGSPGKSLYLGLWMFVGVVGFWMALGVLASSVSAFADPSRLFGIWWVTLGIGVLIVLMGVGIMGAFSINLPKQVYAVNPKADSASGSFMFGVMTAILGLPCFGFVAGALLVGAAAMPWWVVLTIFAALGVGMGLPYLVLSAKPRWVEKIPRTGPASELVKQVMGLLLLAAGAYFAGSGVLALLKSNPETPALAWWVKSAHWWFVGLFAVAAGVWLAWRTFRITRNSGRRTVFTLVGLVIASGGAFAAADQTMKARSDFWIPFTETELARGIESGRVVVLDFTADWCLNCKALESAVLLKNPVKSLLLGEGVLPLKADLTSTSAPGWDKLRDIGRTGIPTLVIFGPGLDDPWIASAYTSDQVVNAIERARGGAVATAGR